MDNQKHPCKVGDRIRLDFMGDDPCPIEAGTTGTVREIMSASATSLVIRVDWDVNRSLNLCSPPDQFTVTP